MEQILAGIKDLQSSMFELKQEVRENSDRLDRLEFRQTKLERTVLKEFSSVHERLGILEAGQNTMKSQLSNINHQLDSIENHQDVLGQAYLRNKSRLSTMEEQMKLLQEE